jgi:uridine kinase
MNKSNNTPPKPFVIVISGSVASGKSTVAAALSGILGNAPVLTFDHYAAYVEWPQDMQQWIEAGADPNHIHIPKLKEDLLSLLHGKEIHDPSDGKILRPSKYILLEEPSGRERQEISNLIDLVVYIDTPQDICVTRLVERAIDMEEWQSKGTFSGQAKDDLVRQMDAVALWITQYQQARSMYIGVSDLVKHRADIVINGMNTVEYSSREIIAFLTRQAQLL